MSDTVLSVAAIALCLALIPLLVWIVLRVKRRAGRFALAYSLFFGWERMFDGAADKTEMAQDPEWQQQPGAAAPPSPEKTR